jgi:CHAT domain-containing protein/Tfp pilus assembly protein PilF
MLSTRLDGRSIPRLVRRLLFAHSIFVLAGLIAMVIPNPVDSTPSNLERAEELNRRAIALIHIGRFNEASPIAKEALALREGALDPEHPLIAESLNVLGVVLQESDYKAARPLLERGLRIRERTLPLDHPAIAESLTDLSRALYAGGQFTVARPLLERALRIRESQLGPLIPDVAVTLIHPSIVVSQLGDLHGSRSLMERALSILNPLEEDYPLELAMGLNYYGNILRRQGEFAESRFPLERSLTIRERLLGSSHPHVARTLTRMGMLEAVTGNYEGALRLFERALRINESALGVSHAEVAGDLNEIGSAQRALGRLTDARASFERALKIQKEAIGPHHPFVAVTLNALGQVTAQVNNMAEAESFFLEALQVQERALGREHVFSTETLTNLGYLEVQRGRLREAANYFERAERIKETNLGAHHPDVAASLLDLARAHHAQGNLRVARGLYERARRIFLTHISTNQNLDDTAQSRVWAQQLKGLYDYELLLVTIANKPSYDTNPASAIPDSFLVAEQARGWIVQSAIARAIARESLGSSDDRQLVRTLDERRRQRQAIWNKLNELYSFSVEQENVGEAERLKKDLEVMQRGIETDTKQLESSSPRYAELAFPKPATLMATQSLLASHEALVSWLSLPDRVCMWLVRSKSPPLYRESLIPRTKLTDLVNRVRSSLTAPDVLSSDTLMIRPFDVEAARELYRYLIAPVRNELGVIEHLILIPDSLLLSLPLATLISDYGGTPYERLAALARAGQSPSIQDLVLYKDLPWLGSSYSLSIVPSASILKLLRESPRPNNSEHERFIGFGDPVLHGTGSARGGVMPKRRGVRVDVSELHKLNRLPGTRKELLAIAAALEVPREEHVFLSEQATELQVRRLNRSGRLGSNEVLAFSTHGLLAGELEGLTQPALVLTPPSNPTEDDDGLLSLEDILRLNLAKTKWVILSACNTAGGEGSGESLTGLARAFFFAGAKSLLVSQWSVDDVATQFLMTEIFKYYGSAKSIAPAEALRHGMQAAMAEAARNSGHAYFAHPFAWAAFFLVGEGNG